jgi:RecB family endonuclease NucS
VSDNTDEVLFTVVDDKEQLARPIRIEDLGMTEPSHLEKWVIQYPQALGAGVLIVASQYDRWVSPNGTESKDRLDLLGLSVDGRLVVAELKRGRAPETVELQAVKYAAMSSRFTLEQLFSHALVALGGLSMALAAHRV